MNCDCGDSVFIKKSGECRACYMKRWRSEHPEKLSEYATKALTDEQRERRRKQYHARNHARAEANRDRRPIDVVVLEKTEEAFAARERHLRKRREWNAANREKRRAYRRAHPDHTKTERNRRASDKRELETGRRSHASSRASTPERIERQRRWRDENRAYVNAQMRKYRQR